MPRGHIKGSKQTAKRQLVTARVLTKANTGQVLVRVVNPTDQQVVVPQGARIGEFELLPPDIKVIGLTQGTSDNCKTHATTTPDPRVNTEVKKPLATADELSMLDQLLDLSKGTLNSEQQAQLRTLLHKYRDVFALGDHELGCAVAVKHKVNLLPGTTPISLRAYRTNPHQKAIIEQQVQQMLKAGIIEESRSAWAAPVVLVAKPGGQPPSILCGLSPAEPKNHLRHLSNAQSG